MTNAAIVGLLIRSAMGTIFKLPYHLSPILPETLARLRQANIICTAAQPHTSHKFQPNTDLRRDVRVVPGFEGTGIRQATLAARNEVVAMPMLNNVDSLSVRNAAAVFFYEDLRQRMMPPLCLMKRPHNRPVPACGLLHTFQVESSRTGRYD